MPAWLAVPVQFHVCRMSVTVQVCHLFGRVEVAQLVAHSETSRTSRCDCSPGLRNPVKLAVATDRPRWRNLQPPRRRAGRHLCRGRRCIARTLDSARGFRGSRDPPRHAAGVDTSAVRPRSDSPLVQAVKGSVEVDQPGRGRPQILTFSLRRHRVHLVTREHRVIDVHVAVAEGASLQRRGTHGARCWLSFPMAAHLAWIRLVEPFVCRPRYHRVGQRIPADSGHLTVSSRAPSYLIGCTMRWRHVARLGRLACPSNRSRSTK